MQDLTEISQGRYQISRRIKETQTNSLYEGFDEKLKKNVVIERCLEEHEQNLADETKLLTEIKHDAFLTVIDNFTEEGSRFVVMEAADGDYLSDTLEALKVQYSFMDVMNWADQMLDALHYLHLHLPPVIYGDIKPQNLVLTRDSKIKLITSAILKNRWSNKTDSFGRTSFISTLLNYSPLEQIWNVLDSASQKVITSSYDEKSEIILKQPLDARSDIYSLGALLYRILSKQLPVDALERSIDMMEGKPDPLPALCEVNPEIPPEISDILMKTLEIKRENRFDSAVILQQVLRTAFVRIKEREAENAVDFRNQQNIEPVKAGHSAAKAGALQTETVAVVNKSIFGELDSPSILDLPPVQNNFVEQTDASREIERLKKRLREAEEKRLQAEKRAAETEKRLSEKAAEKSESKSARYPEYNGFVEEVLEINQEVEPDGKIEKESPPEEKLDQIEIPSPIVPKEIKSDYARDYSSDESGFLFNNAEIEKRSGWKVPVLAAALLILAGAAFGAWFFISGSGSGSAEQTISQQVSVETPQNEGNTNSAPAPNLSEQNIETQIQPTVETASETSVPDESPAAPEVTENQIADQSKPTASTTSRTKKPAAKTEKPENRKKPVSVDDLINDF